MSNQVIRVNTFLDDQDRVTPQDIFNLDYFFQHANIQHIKDIFKGNEVIEWEKLKNQVSLDKIMSYDSVSDKQRACASQEQNQEEVELEMKIHCKKNHLILLLDVSPSMYKYDFLQNSLNIQNLETICQSLLRQILDSVHKHSLYNWKTFSSTDEQEPPDHFPPQYQQRTRITVYLFGMTYKDIELVINYVVLSQENIEEIFKQIVKSIMISCNKMLSRLSPNKQCQNSTGVALLHTEGSPNGKRVSPTRQDENDKEQSAQKEDFQISITQAIGKIQQSLVIHGQKLSFTKMIIVTDGLSIDFDEADFYNSVSKTVKSIGYSCHILITGKSQILVDSQYGQIIDDEAMKMMSVKMNGQFHYLTVIDELNTNKTKTSYAYFSCCNSDFSNMLTSMLMIWTLKYPLKQFTYSFTPEKQQELEELAIPYIEVSQDKFRIKLKKAIYISHRYYLEPHVSISLDTERFYLIAKLRHLEGWKSIRPQKGDKIELCYEYRVNAQAKIYYLAIKEGKRYRVFLFQDLPTRLSKRQENQELKQKIFDICKSIEKEDKIAFNAYSFMQYPYEKQYADHMNSKELIDLWEKYYQVKTLSFLQIPKEKIGDERSFRNQSKFYKQVLERVESVADKRVSKYRYFVKVNKDEVYLLEESLKEKGIHFNQGSQIFSEKEIFLTNQKGMSFDEGLLESIKLRTDEHERRGSFSLKNNLFTSQNFLIGSQQFQNGSKFLNKQITSLAILRVDIKSYFITDIKMAFQNFPKDQQKQLVQDLKKSFHYFNFKSDEISVISNSVNFVLDLNKRKIGIDSNSLTVKWQWMLESIHSLQNVFNILVSLRKNGQFKEIQLQKRNGIQESVFLTEFQFKRLENKNKYKRIFVAHFISLKKYHIEVKIFCENALDLVSTQDEGVITAQKLLNQYMSHVRHQEESIIKRLYTVHSIHRHSIAKRKDSNNFDPFVQIVLDSLKPFQIANLNKGLTMLRGDFESMKDISSYKKRLEEILKDEYSRFDMTKEHFLDYTALFSNSYLKKANFFPLLKGEQVEDQSRLLEFNKIYYERCLEYIQSNNDHSVMNSKKSYLIEVKNDFKGYISCKFLDYKIILLTFFHYDDCFEPIDAQVHQNNSNLRASSRFSYSPSRNSSDVFKNDTPKQKAGKIELPHKNDVLNSHQLPKKSILGNHKIEKQGFQIDFYLMDIKSCENNTNPTSRDFEKYMQGIEQYIESITHQFNFNFALACFDAISSNTCLLNSSSIEKSFKILNNAQKSVLVSLKEFIPNYLWFHKEFVNQKKMKNQQISNAQGINYFTFEDTSTLSQQPDKNYLEEDNLFLANNHILTQRSRSNTKEENIITINPIEQFDSIVLNRAQNVLDILINHFFSKIPGTSFYYTDYKKPEDLRKLYPKDYDLAAEFLPIVTSAIPKIFLKIKFCKGSVEKEFKNLKETFSIFIEERKSKEKDNSSILFEFFVIQSDPNLKEIKQQPPSSDPQSTATKKTTNFFQNFKLACCNIIKIINLDFYRVNTPLSLHDLEKITKTITEIQLQSKEKKKAFNLDEYKLLTSTKGTEILLSQIKDERNHGALHLNPCNDSKEYFYQIFSSEKDKESGHISQEKRLLFKRLQNYTSYVIPFWFILKISDHKVEIYLNSLSFLVINFNQELLQEEINEFLFRVYYRANTVILVQDMKRILQCPNHLDIPGLVLIQSQSNKTDHRKPNLIQKQFNFTKAKPEVKEQQVKKRQGKSFKADLYQTLYFPLQEVEEINGLITNMVFNNFRIHNSLNTYLYFEGEEIYIICFHEISPPQIKGNNQSSQPTTSQPANSEGAAFVNTSESQATQYSTLIQQIQTNSSSIIAETLSKYFTLEEFLKGKKFLKLEIYGMGRKYNKDTEEAICKQVVESQTLETIEKVGSNQGDVIRIIKTDFDSIFNSKYRKKFRYKFPKAIVDHASFMYYFKQNIEKIMSTFTIVNRSFNQVRNQNLDQTKDICDISVDQGCNQQFSQDCEVIQQFDKFITDNYGEMRVVKVDFDKNSFKFLFNSSQSRHFFGICMFLMDVILLRKKPNSELEEVSNFYPVIPLKYISKNQNMGLNAIETISLGCGYSQNDWSDQSSFVFNFLSNDSPLEEFSAPSIYNFFENKFFLENPNQKSKEELETLLPEEYFLDLEIRNKGTLEEESLIEYLTEILNQICLDYLFETILQRSMIRNLDDQYQNQRVQLQYFFNSCLNGEKLFHKLQHKSFYMKHQKYSHKTYHLIWPSLLNRCSSILEREIKDKCKFGESQVQLPAIYVIDDSLGYCQIFETFEDMEIFFFGNYKTSISLLKKQPQLSFIICGNLLQQGVNTSMLLLSLFINFFDFMFQLYEKKYDSNIIKSFERLKEDQGVQLNPVEKEEFDIFTSRNFYARIVVSQRSIQTYFYNFNQGTIKAVSDQIETFSKWEVCRYYIQKHVLLQKLGVYTHFCPYIPTKSQIQNESRIDKIHDTLTQLKRNAGEVVNIKQFLKFRQVYNVAADKQENLIKMNLTRFMSTMIYNIFPTKEMEGMIENFEQNYYNLLLVSFQVIKPKFTKSHYFYNQHNNNNSKKVKSNQNIDSLIIHGGPFLNFVQDFYINDFNKQFFKHICDSCSPSNSKFIDTILIKKLENVAEQIKDETYPIILFIVENYNYKLKNEVSQSDVVAVHIEDMEEEDNQKRQLANKVFYEVFTEQIQNLESKGRYVVKHKKSNIHMNEFLGEENESMSQMKRNYRLDNEEQMPQMQYSNSSLSSENQLDSLKFNTTLKPLPQKGDEYQNLSAMEKDMDQFEKEESYNLNSYFKSKENSIVLMKVQSKTLFMVILYYNCSEIRQIVYQQSQDKTDLFETISNNEINFFNKEIDISSRLLQAHLNLIYRILCTPQNMKYPDINIVRTLAAVQKNFLNKQTLKPYHTFIETSILEIQLGYFFTSFKIQNFIEFLKNQITSQKIPLFRKVDYNMFLECPHNLSSHITSSQQDFFIIFNCTTSLKNKLSLFPSFSISIDQTANICNTLSIQYCMLGFNANEIGDQLKKSVIASINSFVKQSFMEILPLAKKAFISIQFYEKIIESDDLISHESLEMLQANCFSILMANINPKYFSEIAENDCFDSSYLTNLRIFFKSLKQTVKDKSNSFTLFIPIEEPAISMIGAILLPINEKNCIVVNQIKLLSLWKHSQEEISEIMYKYLNEIILNWIYYINEAPYSYYFCD